LAAAEVQWLPNLTTGLAYNRFDGQTQNQAGNVFGVSRSNLFANGGVGLSLDVSDAIYRPLIEQRLRNAEQLRHQAAGLTAEFEAVSAYLDLVQIYGQLAINSETTLQAESMLASAKYAQAAKLDRSAGDVNRAQAEVIVRRIERLELEGKVGIASARLGKLLLLPPQVRLVPADVAAVPLTLIDPATGLDDLVRQAIANRPELAANREAIAAAWERVRKQQRGPWFPKIQVVDQVGAFGGGLNRNIEMFSSRNTIAAQVYWEIKNLGYGNRADIDERRAVLQQAHMQQVEAQARLIADIVEAAQTSAAKYESISLSEQAVKEATELYRIAKEGTLNVVDAKNLFDALRPLQALQLLNNTRTAYLSAIIELNKSQCRLLTLIGQSPRSAMPLDAPR
jgi:outer membrane protein TolC